MPGAASKLFSINANFMIYITQRLRLYNIWISQSPGRMLDDHQLAFILYPYLACVYLGAAAARLLCDNSISKRSYSIMVWTREIIPDPLCGN